MRTTFTLDPDIVPKLKALVRRKKSPMRKVLNDLIRAAIGAELGPVNATQNAFEVKSQNLQLKAGLDPTKLNSLADQIDLDGFLSSSD